MRSRARILLDKSSEAMLAAVEVYNKPAFTYREESFSVLAVNAWELLLKARILELDGNKLAAILEYESRTKTDGKPSQLLKRKRNRVGNFITLGIFKAYDRLTNDYSDTIAPAVRQNLEAIVEIRDNAVHFFNKQLPVVKCIHEIGAACLKNYINLVRRWFGVDLSRNGIFLMPLAFMQPPSSLEGIVLNGEERHLLEYLAQLRTGDDDDGTKDFNVAMTIEVRVRRSKSVDAVPFAISKAPDALPVMLQEEQIREAYPLDYEILTAHLRRRYTNFKVNAEYHSRRKGILEKDPKLCHQRLLDPAKPSGIKKPFFSSNIIKEFDKYYEKAVAGEPAKPVSAG